MAPPRTAIQQANVPRAIEPKKSDPLIDDLTTVLQGLYDLGNKIANSITTVTHADRPSLYDLSYELEGFLTDWKRHIETAQAVHPKMLRKLQELQLKGPTQFLEPIPARALLQVIVLHLLGEQSMTRRLEELHSIERKKREYVTYLETGVKTLYDNFEEVASRLNLLVYMQTSLQRDGVLPANILYNAKIPKVIVSPFGAAKMQSLIVPQAKVDALPAAPAQIHKITPNRAPLSRDGGRLIKLRDQERNNGIL